MTMQFYIGFLAGMVLIYATDWICWKISGWRLRLWARLDAETSASADAVKARCETSDTVTSLVIASFSPPPPQHNWDAPAPDCDYGHGNLKQGAKPICTCRA